LQQELRDNEKIMSDGLILTTGKAQCPKLTGLLIESTL
jgi:hypothetical protein